MELKIFGNNICRCPHEYWQKQSSHCLHNTSCCYASAHSWNIL